MYPQRLVVLRITILKPALVPTVITPDEVNFMDTYNHNDACDGCKQPLGEDNPKLSVRVGRVYYLLCKKCWTSQGIEP